MGRRRRNRSGLPDLVGILVVDKPGGMTSHDVVARVRRIAGQHRVGHTGTLDPMATGVLVLCLGRATRLVPFLQGSPKTYEATAVFGIETDSQDADGTVVSRNERPIGRDEVATALAALVGDIEQVPPMVSAIKVGGERLHHKARRGETVERRPRAVTVHEIEVTGFDDGPPATVTFVVACSPGTYIRTLAHDAGRAVGVGAHLSSLRRTHNAGFALEDAHALAALPDDREALAECLVGPLAAVARTLPIVTVDASDVVASLLHGGRLPEQRRGGTYAVVHDGRLVGIWSDRDGAGRAEVVWMRPEDMP